MNKLREHSHLYTDHTVVPFDSNVHTENPQVQQHFLEGDSAVHICPYDSSGRDKLLLPAP